MKRFALVIVAVLALAPACGGGKSDANSLKAKDASAGQKAGDTGSNGSGSGATSTTAKAGSTPTTSKSGSKGTTTTVKSTAGTNGSNGGSTTTTGKPVRITLGRTCVRRGLEGDAQSLKVEDLTQGQYVGYSTTYNKEWNEMRRPDWKTGYGYGKPDDKGVYEATWHLPEDVPAGTAEIMVIANGSAHGPYTFKVVEQKQSC